MSPPPLASFADALHARLHGLALVERGAPIAQFTTYRLGGPAAVLVKVGSLAAVAALADVVGEFQPPVLVVGRGSNLLVSDRGFPGVAVVLEGEFTASSVDADRSRVRAGGGVALQTLARATAADGWSGLEFYVGIPGSVGGAVRMNAGGHGQETRDVLTGVEVFGLADDPGTRHRPLGPEGLAALGLGYRHSNLGPADVVLGAEFSVSRADAVACQETIAGIVRWRREHQPGGSNGGSVFRNPPDDSAGRLIDALGLKGLRVGGAIVSPRHANFFQAEPGASADDVHALIVEVQARVLAATGILLVPELKLVGFDQDPVAGAEPGRR